MENLNFDVVVIGSGPGGTEAARILAAGGRKVALVEQGLVGGECLHWGCIPSKVYLHSAHLYETMKKMGDAFGVVSDGGVRFDFAKLVERRKKVIGMLHRGLESGLRALGVEIVAGRGTLVGPNTVKVMTGGVETILSAKFVILATGSSPRVPEGVKIGGRIMTNREVFLLEEQPKSILITGGGTIGCEMASFFSQIGTQVTVVERMERFLMHEDREISAEFLKLLTRNDVKVEFATNVVSMVDNGLNVHVVLEKGKGASAVREELDVDHVLVAAGRALNNDVCDWNVVGIKTDAGSGTGTLANARVLTNGFMQTSVANVYAIGDLAGKVLLAYTAEREGEIAAYHVMQMKMDGVQLEVNYKAVPSVIFTNPEIASVGMSEETAKASGKNVVIKKAMFAANSKALVMAERDGFVKVVCDAVSGVVLGVHIIGPDATTMIDKATLAVERGITATQMLDAIAGHPVTSEALEEALEMVVEHVA